MERYEAMICRRQALGVSKETLASEVGINVRYIEFYESGKNIGRDYESKITETLFAMTKRLGNFEHYRFRIMELALKIQRETDQEILIKDLAHMMVECGKAQMDTFDAERFLQ